MRLLGGCIIGVITGLVTPIYDFGISEFSGKNLVLTLCFLGLWHIIYSAIEKGNA